MQTQQNSNNYYHLPDITFVNDFLDFLNYDNRGDLNISGNRKFGRRNITDNSGQIFR